MPDDDCPDSPEFDSRFDVPLRGVDVDGETRCDHYHTDRDVIAIQFPCCGVYYPCFECHRAIANHEAIQWPRDRFDEPAILCGVCGERLSVETYLDSGYSCPACDAEFNPGCRTHAHLYFDTA
ncbi:hypothetical protein AUR64_14935 [Haloprofundus marisrubri]|uniref:CHY-type domain-containing protein n=1 Tax=Haloprofundus marisrubri TaxID=1514971 RepID=A0A0W1R6L2_9EURY|nr:CHY zinc finger protein [Haloprofundus marisrubri]KTG09091.1 hypothetical protein AUR64_14935 [Haloprofundus marisrubri]